MDNYRELALRTNAGEIHEASEVSLQSVYCALNATSGVGATLVDPIKKNLFYAKDGQALNFAEGYLNSVFVASEHEEDGILKWVDLPNETIKAYFEAKGVSVDMLHGVLGIATEAAEIAELVQENKLDREKVVDEVGDLLWYINLVLADIGVSFSEVQTKNIEKLRKRFPNKFDADRAINRD